MKFIYADSLDVVDEGFNFVSERSSRASSRRRGDLYPHEYFPAPPYDGLLVSRAIVGDAGRTGKYSHAEAMRFRRDGARTFLRYEEKRFPGSMVFGDCGTFSYRDQKVPPYKPEDTVEFYHQAGFTHGCSIDHLIFDFDDGGGRRIAEIPKLTRERYEVTLELASQFLPLAKKHLGKRFEPLGVIQGWSAPSMAEAAAALVRMGYTYLAVGGLVPLKTEQIARALAAIREAIPRKTRLHLLGFAKIESLPALAQYGITSFDTTSPLLRAFKDAKRNYFAIAPNGLDYYTAIRVPQALENVRLKKQAQEGKLDQERAVSLEEDAMLALRRYANRRLGLQKTVDHIVAYVSELEWHNQSSAARRHQWEHGLRTTYARTLADRPWERCACRVCQESGIDAVIFRSSNRNKRRGFHNMYVFHNQLKTIRN